MKPAENVAEVKSGRYCTLVQEREVNPATRHTARSTCLAYSRATLTTPRHLCNTGLGNSLEKQLIITIPAGQKFMLLQDFVGRGTMKAGSEELEIFETDLNKHGSSGDKP
jgi:hypothetical protein